MDGGKWVVGNRDSVLDMTPIFSLHNVDIKCCDSMETSSNIVGLIQMIRLERTTKQKEPICFWSARVVEGRRRSQNLKPEEKPVFNRASSDEMSKLYLLIFKLRIFEVHGICRLDTV